MSDYLLPDGEAFYLLSTGEEENDHLEGLLNDGYNILDFFSIQPTIACQKLLKGHHMIFRTTPLGFLVAIKVNEHFAGASKMYEPFIPLSSGLRLGFHLRLRNPNFINFSNIRVRPNIPGKFFFTNVDPAGRLSFPALSLPPPPYLAGRSYEMGELVEDGGVVYQALINTLPGVAPGDPAWSVFDAPVRYANYNDQRLVPFRFKYQFTFDPSTPIHSAEFELIGSTVTGEGLIVAGGTGEGPFVAYPLDFSKEKIGPFTLEVNSPEGYVDEKEVILGRDEDEGNIDFGFIEIGHETGLGDFRLLENTGELRTENGETQFPAFKVFFRSRATYWQYRMHQKEDLNRLSDPDFQAFPADRSIVTVNPMLLRKAGQEMSVRNIDNDDIPLPSPVDLKIKPRKDKIYSEILLPRINL
jgi:hypothetical protein